MRGREIGKRWLPIMAAAALGALGARAASYTYTGLGVAGVWNDVNNWGGAGAPVNLNDDATIPDGFSPTFTTGFPTTPTLTYFTTGDGLVTLPSSLKMIYQGSPWRSERVNIGTGGLTIAGSGGVEMSSEYYFRSAGPVTMDHLYMVNKTPEQTGTSTWDIKTIRLGNNGQAGYEIRAWNILDGANTTFTQVDGNGSSPTWTGSPIITGGRPQWNLTRAALSWSQSSGQWNLQNHTLYGDVVQLDGMNGSNPRLIGSGATVDVNVLRIAYGYTSTDGQAYVDLDNSTVLIQGAGTSSFPAYDNRSQRNDLFDLRDNTTVTFHQSCWIDTGSRDRDSADFDPADWQNNFAFDAVRIAEGATVTLTGTANIEGGGNTALYAASLVGEGAGATVNLNGRNVYLLSEPENVTFDDSLGGTAYWPAAVLPPSVAISAASAVTHNSATLHGQVLSTGGGPNPDVYFCLDSTDKGTGTTNDWAAVISMGANWGAGAAFSTNVTGLAPEQDYAYRAYVTNAGGAVWSTNALFFRTPETPPPTTALPADYTWTGNGRIGKWNDPNNWTNATVYGWPGAVTGTHAGTDGAIFPNGTAAINITNGFTVTSLNLLQTGDALVTLPAGLALTPRSSPFKAANVVIGTGGLTLTSGGIGFGNNGETGFTSAGPVTMAALQMNSANPTQTGGFYDITTIRLRGNGSGEVRAWTINDADNTTITSYAHNGNNFTWVGNPVLDGRPNWDLMNGSSYGTVHGRWDLKGFLLYGSRLQIDSYANSDPVGGFYTDRLIADGGTVDVNTVRIALGGNAARRGAYMALTNATIHVRGTGTAWENDSLNNTAFNLRHTTTVTFGSSGGTLNVDTGSKDRNSAARDPADWENNFAFDKIAIAAGATVTLTGDANIEGGGNTALYATSLVGEGAGATVNLNGRNVYLLKNASNITFTGAGKVYQQPRGTTLLLR